MGKNQIVNEAVEKIYAASAESEINNSENVGAIKSSSFNKADWKGKIMTVNGLVPAESLNGITLCHEHLTILHQGPDVDLDDHEMIIRELKKFYETGGRTIVEHSNERIGRNPKALRRMSIETGVNIIMGSGYYKDEWMPYEVRYKTADDIAQEIYNDIVVGIDVGEGERVHAGHIGEIGTSKCLTDNEVRSVRGSVRAQNKTGAAISIHFDYDALPSERDKVIRILEEEDADPRRTVIQHIPCKLDNIPEVMRFCELGFQVSFDHFGTDIDPRMQKMLAVTFEESMVTIKECIRFGLIDHLLISTDICFKAGLIEMGGHGYCRVANEIIPFLRKLKVNEYDIERMTGFQARKVFSLGGRFPSY